MILFGYKQFVSLGHVFQCIFVWNLKEVGQIQWLGAWVSHWNGDRGFEEQRRKDDIQRGMKKKFREKVHTKSRGRHELHEHKHEETFEQGSLVVISVSCYVDFPYI